MNIFDKVLTGAISFTLTLAVATSCIIPRDVHPERSQLPSPRPSPSLLTGRQPAVK